MTETILGWLGDALILLGAFFVVTGAVGLLRMPDFFTRLHPAGVTDSLGIPCIVIGLILHSGIDLTSGKLLLLLLFLMLTSPTACHALAKAAMLSGMIPKDKMAREEQQEICNVPPSGNAGEETKP